MSYVIYLVRRPELSMEIVVQWLAVGSRKHASTLNEISLMLRKLLNVINPDDSVIKHLASTYKVEIMILDAHLKLGTRTYILILKID